MLGTIGSLFDDAANVGRIPIPLPVPVSRSFLFEIIDRDSQWIVESFALVLPPQSYTIREKQRVNVTKTFGNIFVDDYGPDCLELSIQGISGTAHAFPTYESEGMSAGSYGTGSSQIYSMDIEMNPTSLTKAYTHRTAFYAFRDRIMRYKDSFSQYSDYVLRVYDLHDEQIYDCILLDFTLSRTSEKPLYYPFAINLLVYRMPDKVGIQNATLILPGGNIFDLLDAIDNFMSWLDTAFAYVQAVKNSVALIQNTVNLMRAKFNTYLTMARTILTSPLDLCKQCLDLMGSFSGFIKDARTQYKMTVTAWANAKETLTESWKKNLKLYTEAVGKGSQSTRTDAIERDAGLKVSLSTSGTVGGTVGVNIGGVSDGKMGAPPADKLADIKTFVSSGFSVYTVKGGDTLQSIAQTHLGDSSLWVFIASINNIIDNVELSTKEKIYLPVSQTRTATSVSRTQKQSKDKFIFTEDLSRDPYGTDIKLDTDGNIVIGSSNDVVLISGLANIQQSVDRMFKTLAGSVIKQTAYGISVQPGIPGTDMALKYLRSSVRMTLMGDSRIQSISSLNLTIDGDIIHVSADLNIVGYDNVLPISAAI